MIELGPDNYFELGDWRAVCDECGVRTHASKLRLRWDQQWCCFLCWELRNPQDFAKGIPDKPTPPWQRPVPPPIWLSGSTSTGSTGTTQRGLLIGGRLAGGPLLG